MDNLVYYDLNLTDRIAERKTLRDLLNTLGYEKVLNFVITTNGKEIILLYARRPCLHVSILALFNGFVNNFKRKRTKTCSIITKGEITVFKSCFRFICKEGNCEDGGELLDLITKTHNNFLFEAATKKKKSKIKAKKNRAK